MSDDRIRIEVEHFPAGDRQVLTVDPSKISPAHRRQAAELLDHLIDILAEDLGLHPEKVALAIVAELVQRHHDRAAYHREAARRGVLAL